jgi:hypothetical protein
MRTTCTTLARPAAASISAGLVVWAARAAGLWSDAAPWIVLDALVFGATYMGLWFVMPGGREHLNRLKSMLEEIKPGKAKECMP